MLLNVGAKLSADPISGKCFVEKILKKEHFSYKATAYQSLTPQSFLTIHVRTMRRNIVQNQFLDPAGIPLRKILDHNLRPRTRNHPDR